MDGVFRLLDVVYDGILELDIRAGGSSGCYFLFAIVPQRCLLQYGCILFFKAATIPASSDLWSCCCLSLQDILCFSIGLSVVHSSPN